MKDNLVALSADDLDTLRHMLGVRKDSPRKKWGYRNYFATAMDRVRVLERLRAAGLAVKGRSVDGLVLYHATERGGDMADLTFQQIRQVCVPPEPHDNHSCRS